MHISKIAIWLYLLAFTQIVNATEKQELLPVKISLNLRKATLVEVLKKIEKQTDYTFVYNYDDVVREKNVSVNLKNQSLEKALKDILDSHGFVFRLSGKSIVIKREKQKEGATKETSELTPAQESSIAVVKAVTGKVTDEKGEALPGVNISVKGTTRGAVSGSRGEFKLQAEQSELLIFSFIGYKSQEVVVGNQTDLSIRLQPDQTQLEEVVIGYGKERKVNLKGSISTVSAEFLENRPLTNSSQALQGVTGAYVNQAGGQPGKDLATIRIRGVGTLNDNNPLVLVNGIEYSLNDVNPSDIENISVLKDAASASIYGSRAANGVILITTKSGKKGKPQLEYNNYFGWQKATYLPDVVTNSVDWMISRNQAGINEGQPAVFTEKDIEEFRTGTDRDLYPNTDWFDIMFRVAPSQEHNVRLSGGSDHITYSFSLGHLSQEGILIATNAKKYSLNTNLGFKITDRLNAGANISATYWNRHEPAEGAETLVGNVTRALPIYPNILADGRYGDSRFITPGHNVFRHPYAKAVEGGLDTKNQRALVNVFAEYNFPFNIKYKVNVAANKYDEMVSRFIPEVYLYDPKAPNVPKVLRFDPAQRSATRYDNNNLNTSFFQTLAWNKDLGARHHLNALLGFSRESFEIAGFNAYVEGFLGNQLTELNVGTINKNVGGTSSQSRLMSYFGRADYNYSDKYLLEFNFRYDGSSRFASGNRWGFFPSVSGAWRASEEDFLKNIEALRNLKVRASWGKLGNQSVPLYSYSNSINLEQGASFNNTLVAGAAVTTLADQRISWETTTIKNIGLDLAFWNNKLGIVADIFDKSTTDILARINVPAQVGNLTGPITNLYNMSNKGLELTATHANYVGQVNYNVGAGIAFIKNKVSFLNGDVQYSGDQSLYIIKEGYPVNAYYLYEAQGIFKTAEEVKNHAFQGKTTAPGDIIYRDLNGDDVIDSDDRMITGRTVPKFTYSFNFGVNYKGFDLGAFFQGVQGIDMYPKGNLAFPNFNGAGITKDVWANSWTEENPNARYPRLGEPKRGSGANYKNSTFWLRDGSFLRLKNIQISYNIPSKVLSAIKLQKVKVFANAQNALTFSKYKLSDPERNTTREDLAEYPSVKTFTVGVNVTF
ncbi:TonB-dependent receptor [Dyadobacter sp. CY323]|uniref:TonB-dependent receptor n=1 Tax=Dyadobacter sp. CY323 TaxID=2907302 RepID=UPI001F47D342|nr:TonB-dependent receptor [Dyadobacter sp. CY323]MCE6991112.1 TonB-dependent receptor [Dyadobacter sp. CY323]